MKKFLNGSVPQTALIFVKKMPQEWAYWVCRMIFAFKNTWIKVVRKEES